MFPAILVEQRRLHVFAHSVLVFLSKVLRVTCTWNTFGLQGNLTPDQLNSEPNAYQSILSELKPETAIFLQRMTDVDCF